MLDLELVRLQVGGQLHQLVGVGVGEALDLEDHRRLVGADEQGEELGELAGGRVAVVRGLQEAEAELAVSRVAGREPRSPTSPRSRPGGP